LEKLFKGRHFERDIIVLCMRWQLSYKLSSRDLVEIMAERGLAVSHTTIMRWVQRFVPAFKQRWNHYARMTGCSWRDARQLCARLCRSCRRNLPGHKSKKLIFSRKTNVARESANDTASGPCGAKITRICRQIWPSGLNWRTRLSHLYTMIDDGA
jgi:hypothetical protein